MLRTFLVVLALAGCAAPEWEHPTKSGADWDRDLYACDAQFASVTVADPAYSLDMRQRCMRQKGWRRTK